MIIKTENEHRVVERCSRQFLELSNDALVRGDTENGEGWKGLSNYLKSWLVPDTMSDTEKETAVGPERTT